MARQLISRAQNRSECLQHLQYNKKENKNLNNTKNSKINTRNNSHAKSSILACVNMFLQDWITSQNLSFRKLDRRTKNFEWKLVGQVRSKYLNPNSNLDCVLHSYFNELKDILGATPKQLIRILSHLDPKLYSKLTSDITKFAKRTLSLYFHPQQWICFVDLGTLIGYPKEKFRVFKDDVHNWLVKPVDANLLDIDEIVTEITTLLGPVSSDPTSFQTFDSWLLARWPWMGTGASKESELELNNYL